MYIIQSYLKQGLEAIKVGKCVGLVMITTGANKGKGACIHCQDQNYVQSDSKENL